MSDDAHLTDHEWRLKMAREGKAIYTPGKAAGEAPSDTARTASEGALSVRFGPCEAQGYLDACDDLVAILWRVEATLRFLHEHLDGGAPEGDGHAVAAVCELAALAIRHEADDLDGRLAGLTTKLRAGVKQQEAPR